MGGNALKDFGVKRLVGEDYSLACQHAEKVLNDILSKYGQAQKARMIPCWREKTDHGDVDVILPLSLRDALSTPNLIEELSQRFDCEVHWKTCEPIINVTAPHPQGGYFQLDLIFIREESLDFAQSFYSWGDVSTLLMRLAANMHLAIGVNGLSYKARNGKTVLGRVMLTRDFESTLKYLFLDYSRWQQGFDNLTQVFEWFTASKAFNDRFFLLENLNASTQKDVLKRPGYTAFLEWLKDHPEVNSKYHWKSYIQNLPGSLWKPFPEAQKDYEAFFSAIQRKKDAQAKFNGHMISEATGLTGRDLGEFIMDFKKPYDEYAFQAYVMNTAEESLLSDIKAHFENYKSS